MPAVVPTDVSGCPSDFYLCVSADMFAGAPADVFVWVPQLMYLWVPQLMYMCECPSWCICVNVPADVFVWVSQLMYMCECPSWWMSAGVPTDKCIFTVSLSLHMEPDGCPVWECIHGHTLMLKRKSWRQAMRMDGWTLLWLTVPGGVGGVTLEGEIRGG